MKESQLLKHIVCNVLLWEDGDGGTETGDVLQRHQGTRDEAHLTSCVDEVSHPSQSHS